MKQKSPLTISDLQKTFDINPIYAQKVLNSMKSSADLSIAKKIIDERPKPFVKWVGGKRQLLKQFRTLGLYPPEGFSPNINRYFEPFVDWKFYFKSPQNNPLPKY